MMPDNYLSATLPNMPEAFKPARLKVAEAAKGIEAVVCEFYGITAETLCSPSRKDEVVMARHIIRYLLHVEEGYGIRTIARCLRKDHSQALKSIKLVKDYISTGGAVKEEITAIRLRLHAQPYLSRMLYSFTGGPLHGQTIDVPPERVVDNTFTHITFGKYKSPFHLLPETIEHRYMPVNDQMIYCEPAKLA